MRISKPFYLWTFVQWTSVLLHSTKRKNIIYYSFTPTCQRKIPAGSNKTHQSSVKPDLPGKGFLKKVMIFQLSCWFVVTAKTLYQVSLTSRQSCWGEKHSSIKLGWLLYMYLGFHTLHCSSRSSIWLAFVTLSLLSPRYTHCHSPSVPGNIFVVNQDIKR